MNNEITLNDLQSSFHELCERHKVYKFNFLTITQFIKRLLEMFGCTNTLFTNVTGYDNLLVLGHKHVKWKTLVYIFKKGDNVDILNIKSSIIKAVKFVKYILYISDKVLIIESIEKADQIIIDFNELSTKLNCLTVLAGFDCTFVSKVALQKDLLFKSISVIYESMKKADHRSNDLNILLAKSIYCLWYEKNRLTSYSSRIGVILENESTLTGTNFGAYLVSLIETYGTPYQRRPLSMPAHWSNIHHVSNAILDIKTSVPDTDSQVRSTFLYVARSDWDTSLTLTDIIDIVISIIGDRINLGSDEETYSEAISDLYHMESRMNGVKPHEEIIEFIKPTPGQLDLFI